MYVWCTKSMKNIKVMTWSFDYWMPCPVAEWHLRFSDCPLYCVTEFKHCCRVFVTYRACVCRLCTVYVSPLVQFAMFYTHTRISNCCKFLLHVGFLCSKAAVLSNIIKWPPMLTKTAYLPPLELNACQKLRIFLF
jgi:hypothetical protein